MSKFEHDLMLFHNNNIFLPTRTLYLSGEVNEEMFSEFIKNLHALDSTKGPINVKIFSEGGCVLSAKAIYDAILACKNLTRGIGYSEVASAASFILQAFDERCIMPNASLMIHIGREAYAMDHPRNIERLAEQNRKDEDWMANIYLDRIREVKPKFRKSQIMKMLEFDTYLSAKECLELNLVDFIGDPQ